MNEKMNAPVAQEKALLEFQKADFIETLTQYVSVLRNPRLTVAVPTYEPDSIQMRVFSEFNKVIGFNPETSKKENDETLDFDALVHMERIVNMLKFIWDKRKELFMFEPDTFIKRQWKHVHISDFYAYIFGLFDNRYSRFIFACHDLLEIEMDEWAVEAGYFSVIHSHDDSHSNNLEKF